MVEHPQNAPNDDEQPDNTPSHGSVFVDPQSEQDMLSVSAADDVGRDNDIPAKAQQKRTVLAEVFTWQNFLIAVLLLLVMLSGAYLRFVGQNWDDFTHLHPDERFLTTVSAALRPVSPAMYFNTAESTLNPNNIGAGFYVYGTLPLYITDMVARLWANITTEPSWTSYNGVHLIGRTVSATADLLTLLFVFLIGRKLYSKWIGLLAAALYAWMVLPIQLSHFWTMDAFTNLPVVIAFWFAVRILDDGKWLNYMGFGLAFGAAIASRVNVVPLAGLAALATLVRLMPMFEIGIAPTKRQGMLIREAGGLIVAAIVSVLTFRIAQPYAFSGPTFFHMIPSSDWLHQMGEAARMQSGNADMPPNHQWASRIPYVFALQNIVIWGMGLPLGIAAWLSWGWAGLQALRGRPTWKRHLLPVVWILVYFGWQGGGWVMSMRYYMPLYPFFAIMAAWGMVTLVRRATAAVQEQRTPVRNLRRGLAWVLLVAVTAFAFVWAFGYTRVYTRQLTRVSASHWILQNIPADFAMTVTAEDGETRLINVGFWNDSTGEEGVAANATRYHTDGEFSEKRRGFIAPLTGTIGSIHIPHLADPLFDIEEESLWIGVFDVATLEFLTEATLTADFSDFEHDLGHAYDIVFDEPITVEAGHNYDLVTRAEAGAPFIVAGAAITVEGPWDDPIPYKVCGLPYDVAWSAELPSGMDDLSSCRGIDGFGEGWYQGLELHMALDEQGDQKRSGMVDALNNGDYLTISSNRFYDTLSRLPMRFPMSMRYYDALFSGELGFELIGTFESSFTFGEMMIADQVLPTQNLPGWVNELEAEEAFHVYDHPTVFVFEKSADYDAEAVERLFYDLDLTSSNDRFAWSDGTRVTNVIPWIAPLADDAPTALMFTSDQLKTQYSNGTWSDLFDRESWVNQNDFFSAVAWWLLLLAVGWITWPTLFALFPTLPDRAFPIAKMSGLLIISWLTWLGASFEMGTWSQVGLFAAMGGLALLSLLLGLRNRAALIAYLREYWRRLLLMEGLTLLLFIVFIGVRLGNPDLWHPSFGGERPMDFAYLNGVLRSTTFPPINPWFSGGYINYYYYGFVLFGAPIKMLGMVPSVAFNLIEASLFALTGIGAFSVAFNLTAVLRKQLSGAKALKINPWVAGVFALLLAVVLGNLDEIRQIVMLVARTGGWRPEVEGEFLPPIVAFFEGIGALFDGRPPSFSTHWWYWNPTRIMVHTGNAINEIPFFTFLYGDPHAHAFALPLTLVAMNWALATILNESRRVARAALESGLALAFGALAVAILRPTNFADYVTYLALGLFAITLANYYWHRAQRPQIFALVDGQEIAEASGGWRGVGFVGGAALYYAVDAFRRLNLTRDFWLRWLTQLGLFVLLGMAFISPYTHWYATADAQPQIWQGAHTPFWAYLDLNGLFLFLIVPLLLWDTARWLRNVPVRSFIGKPRLVLMTLIGLGWLGVITIAAAVLGYSIALVALPLIFWATILFFRPGQDAVLRYIWATVVLALTLTFIVDVIVWAGDIGRQNTVFKFYMQVWLLLSVAGGVGFALLLRVSEAWRGWAQALWRTAAVVLFTIAALYPILATQAKFIDRMAPDAPHTLDGAAFLPYATRGEQTVWFSLEEDDAVIKWLQDNIQGTPVVLEAVGLPYQWAGRISSYTGLPTIIGYDHHQRQQRTIEPLAMQVQQRVLNVREIYESTDWDTVWHLLTQYDVSYIVVGQVERAWYSAIGLGKFDLMVEDGLMDMVYEDGETFVYRINKDVVL